MSTSLSSITISIPATSANMGPGFDSFGIALQLANLVTIEKRREASPLPDIAQHAADYFFKKINSAPIPFSMSVNGNVPCSRGLGSSVTIRLGILMALNKFSGSPFQPSELYALCTALEGHPDNAAPAVFGGFTIARKNHLPLRCNVSPELRFVLLIPNFQVSTEDARTLMPASISVADAAANAADAAVIAAAFSTGNYELLKGSFGDRLHQPFRKALVPFLPKVITAAESAGALGAWLSGSGSTIAALARDNSSAEVIATAMKKSTPGECYTIITAVDNLGAKIEAEAVGMAL